jgi:hypothetical protein
MDVAKGNDVKCQDLTPPADTKYFNMMAWSDPVIKPVIMKRPFLLIYLNLT